MARDYYKPYRLFSIIWSVIRIAETDTYKKEKKLRKRKYCVFGEKKKKEVISQKI